jgi:hypothetical protein
VSCARLPPLARPGGLMRRITGPYETDHEPQSLAVASTPRIADRFCNSLEPALHGERRSRAAPTHGLIDLWRRGRDSNSRGSCEPSGFQDRCIQPLCHLSVPVESAGCVNSIRLAGESRARLTWVGAHLGRESARERSARSSVEIGQCTSQLMQYASISAPDLSSSMSSSGAYPVSRRS